VISSQPFETNERIKAVSKEFNIRALTGDDWKKFRDIRLEALHFYPENFGAQYADELQLTENQWRARLDSPIDRVFGLFHNNLLIGTNGVMTHYGDPEGKTALMIMWYMRTGYQGQGLFHDLIKAGIDWAESEPRFNRILVDHRDGNEASRRSNQKHGFTYIGRKPKTWPDGETHDLVMYERKFER
jgi:RimJ/RimL family protein N-acetyltransferase